MAGSDEQFTYAAGDLLPGTPYKVLRALGAGGMGVVYAVEHTFLKRKEALKTIHPELIDRRDIAERMSREASVVGNLRHPNIVQVTGGGIIDDQWKLPYFAMEMLRGKNLRQVLAKRTLTDFQSVYNVAYEILSALEEAHAHGVVHRDVKPENIFLHFDSTRSAGPQVTAKLLDFGVMAVLGGRQSMSFRGTYKYAAPEQLRGDKVSAKTDIYAMALVVYEMIAGRGPFDDHRDMKSLVKAHLEAEAPRVSQFARVHPSIDDLLARALAKDPDKRPGTAMGFALDLRPLKRAPDAPVVLAANTEESLLTTVTGAVTDGGKPVPESARQLATAKDGGIAFAHTKLAEGEPRRAEDKTIDEPIPSWALHGGTLEDAPAPGAVSSDLGPLPARLGLERPDVDRRAVTRTADPIPRGMPTHGTEPIPEPAPDSTRRYLELEEFLLDETSDAIAASKSTPSRRDGTPPPVSPMLSTASVLTGVPAPRSGRRRMGVAAIAVVALMGAAIFWSTTRGLGRPSAATAPAGVEPVSPVPTQVSAPSPPPPPVPTNSAPPATVASAPTMPFVVAATSAPVAVPMRPGRGPSRPASTSNAPAPAKPAPTPSPAIAAAPEPDPAPPPVAPPPAPKSTGDSELKRSVVH